MKQAFQMAQAVLDTQHGDRVSRTTWSTAPDEPLATTSVRVGLHDGYF